MYGKEETKRTRQAFWTAFGTVMKPIFSASGFSINWVNYKTEVKDVYFKMNANGKKVSIGIYIQHKDAGIRALFFEQFLEFKSLLHTILEEEWEWHSQCADEHGKSTASITVSANANIFDKNQWQDMFLFLKTRLIRLDEFWDDAKEIFKSL